jgi:hypothetical protein
MRKALGLGLAVASLAWVASVVVIPINSTIYFDRSNTVQIAWAAYPGKSYVLQATTNLAQPWQNAPTTPAPRSVSGPITTQQDNRTSAELI